MAFQPGGLRGMWDNARAVAVRAGTKIRGLGQNQWALALFGAIAGALIGAWIQSASSNQTSKTIVRASLDQANRSLEAGATAEALAIYEDLLRTRAVSPKRFGQEFAEAQHKSGICYFYRSWEGDQYDNLNKAIICQQEALNIYKPSEHRLFYARAQNELGAALASLAEIHNKADNLNRALGPVEESLKFFSAKKDPLDYSRAQINKANIFAWSSEVSDKRANLYKSLASAKEALRVSESFKDSKEYARALVCLGNAYGQLSSIENRETNIALAIKAFESAKESVGIERDTYYHARVLNNLGVAYTYRAGIENDEAGLDNAISVLREALEIYDDKEYPGERARTESGLAEALLMKGKADNLEEAIQLLNSALKAYTITRSAVKYAEMKISLGDAYSRMAEFQNRRANLNLALRSYEAALKVFDSKYPLPHNDVTSCIKRVRADLAKLDAMEEKMITSS